MLDFDFMIVRLFVQRQTVDKGRRNYPFVLTVEDFKNIYFEVLGKFSLFVQEKEILSVVSFSDYCVSDCLIESG